MPGFLGISIHTTTLLEFGATLKHSLTTCQTVKPFLRTLENLVFPQMYLIIGWYSKKSTNSVSMSISQGKRFKLLNKF